MSYDAFFFDFDGVVADSVEVKTWAFGKLFERFGPEIRKKVIEHHRKNGGMTRKEKFKHYYRDILRKPLDESVMDGLCSSFSSLVVDKVVSCREIPGVGAFLEKWHEQVPCFVISATPDEEILTIVERRGLKGYFREVLGSSRAKRVNLQMLLDKYALQGEKCLFFGDAESDYRAAVACKVNFLGIVPEPDGPLLHVAPKITWARDFAGLIV